MDKVESNRDEDEHDDFEERMTLTLAEQEGEDFNRIKEESRKRKEAILEKYRNQQTQQKSESNLVDVSCEFGYLKMTRHVFKDAEHVKLRGHSLPSSDTDVETSNGSEDGRDIDGFESIVSVGKSPPRNVVQVTDGTSTPGQLGKGTPKGERSNERYYDDIFGETLVAVRKAVRF
ncbi:hypothetical protein LINPERHAP1_LOCUS40286 [Linum perenne]